MLTDEFQKSIFCNADRPQCIEVRQDGPLVTALDTRTSRGFTVTIEDWEVFLRGAKTGQFDPKV